MFTKPTPVSALIHAATLVTAGLYLLVRSSPILEYSSTALLLITLVGASTAFFAATCGLVQNDLKRIIAFSTISQLGYMVMAVGLSQYNVALMHVVNHAFFKALLFLGAGAVIHSFSDQQDVRRLGGLINFLPFTYTAMLVGTLSLLATPWLTGFYSKDLIIELAFAQYSFEGTFAFILGSLTAGLTAFYSFRLISLVFLTKPNGPKTSYLHSHEASLAVIIPLFVLALFSIFFGYIFSDLFVGIGTDFFGNSIFIHPNHITMVEAEFSMDRIVKLLPSILSLLGAVLAVYLYHFTPHLFFMESSITRKIYTFLNGKYLFDVIYNHFFIGRGLQLGYFVSKVLDRGVIEFIGPYGLSNTLTKTGINIAKLDTGVITTYSLYITLGLLSLVFVVFAPVLLDTSIVNEMRLFIIYVASLLLLFTPHQHTHIPAPAHIPAYQLVGVLVRYGRVGAYHYIKESYFNYALFVMMNRYFNFIYRYCNLRYHYSLNILSIIFIFGLTFLFVKDLNLDKNTIVDMIFCFSISFIVSYFILSKFKFSNNFVIRFIQKTVIYSISYFVIISICGYFGLIGTIYCMGPDDKYTFEVKGEVPKKPTDMLLTISGNLLSKSFESLGAAGAGGSAAAAMAKASVGVPSLQRVVLIGSSGFITSAGVLFGIRGANAVADRVELEKIRSLYLSSKHSNPDINRIPSPDITMINSPLEMPTPLGNLVDVIFSYNMLELIIIILLIYIIFNRNILIVISKYIPTKYNNLKRIVDSSISANTKIMNVVIIILVVLLLIFKIVNLFFSYELSNNLDSYVNIYNDIKNSFVIFVITTNKFLLRKTFYNSKSIYSSYI